MLISIFPKLDIECRKFVVCTLSICAALMYSFVFMEQPDEYAHIFRLIESERGDSGAYSIVVGWLGDMAGVDYFGLVNLFEKNENFVFASNYLVCNKCFGGFDYYILRFINQVAVVFFVFFASVFIKNKNLYFLSLVWPSVFYVIAGIGSDSFAVPLIIASTCLIFEEKFILSFMFAFAASMFDRSGYILVIFLSVYIVVYSLRLRLSRLFVFLPLALFCISVVGVLNLIPFDSNFIDLIRTTSIYNYQFEINVFNRLMSIVLSFWYLAGNLSITAMYFEYIVFLFVFVLVILYSDMAERRLLFAAIFAISFMLLVVPTLAQARYFFFLIPIIVSVVVRRGVLFNSGGLFLIFSLLNVVYSYGFLRIYLLA